MAIQPKGVLTRSIWSFFPGQIMAGWSQASDVAVAIGYVSVYNNDAYGQYLWIIDVGFATTALGAGGTGAVVVNLETFPGGSGFSPAAFPARPVLTGGLTQSGLIGSFNSGACVGTTHAFATGNGSLGYSWPHDWPIAIVQPGSSFGVAAELSGTTLTASIAWWVGPPP